MCTLTLRGIVGVLVDSLLFDIEGCDDVGLLLLRKLGEDVEI